MRKVRAACTRTHTRTHAAHAQHMHMRMHMHMTHEHEHDMHMHTHRRTTFGSSTGAIPVNMNTGDATGDLFFDLFEVVIVPLACQQNTTGGHSCTNPEAVGADLMVNKLTLEVDSQYSGYARCNIGINGSDGRGHTCKTGSYCCVCGSYSGSEPCNDTLGREDLYDNMGPKGAAAAWAEPLDQKGHYGCNEKSQPVECYTSNARKKLTKLHPGYWYSSLASGYCGATGSCTWRVVSVDKIITRSCHTRVFGEVRAPARG